MNMLPKTFSILEMEPPSRRLLYMSVCAANLATITCGLTMGWSAPILPKLKGTGGYTIEDSPFDSPISDEDESWLGSLLPAGAIFSPIVAGYAADKLGRKKSLLLSVVPFIVGYLFAASATNVYFFYAKQILCGLTVGAVYTILPMYVTEISDDKVRGSLGSLVQVFTTCGFLLAFLIAPFTYVTVFNVLTFLAPISFVAIFTFMPESPYFYVFVDNHKEAARSLSRLRALPVKDIQRELSKIKIEVEESKRNKGSFLDIFLSGGLRKAFFLSISLATFQQFSLISPVLAYTQDIFAATGSSMSPVLSAIIIGFVQFLAGFITPLLVDKLGRKFFLITCSSGCGTALISLGYFFYLLDNGYDVSSLSFLPLVCLIVLIIAYNVGYGPLPITINGELFPSNVKSYASMAHVGTCFFFSFVMTKYFNAAVGLIGRCGTFWIFGLFAIGAVFFVIFLVPETKGRSLQEIQDILSKKGEENVKPVTSI